MKWKLGSGRVVYTRVIFVYENKIGAFPSANTEHQKRAYMDRSASKGGYIGFHVRLGKGFCSSPNWCRVRYVALCSGPAQAESTAETTARNPNP